MRNWGLPRGAVADKLKSYDVTLLDDCSTADRRSRQGLDNRAEPRTRTPVHQLESANRRQ
jgi:hypothetical protein